jgi:zinc and cadmium transporter
MIPMIQALFAIFVLILISSATLLFYKVSWVRNNLRSLLALAAGALLANALIHILPEGVELAGGWTFEFGLVVMFTTFFHFLLESFLRWRECCKVSEEQTRRLGILNLFGDFWCNVTDGIAITSSFLISPVTGWTTTMAILSHEIPQEVGDYAVLIHSGFKPRQAFFGNFMVALGHLLGFGLSIFLLNSFQQLHPYLLAVAGGSVLYLSLSSLIPEVHNTHKTGFSKKPMLFFLLGMIVVTLTKLIEGH